MQPLGALLYNSHCSLARKNIYVCIVLTQNCIALACNMKHSFNSHVHLQAEKNIMTWNYKIRMEGSREKGCFVRLLILPVSILQKTHNFSFVHDITALRSQLKSQSTQMQGKENNQG